jgi:hypothetical protein
MRVKNIARMMMKEFCMSPASTVLLVVKERVMVGKVVHCRTTVKGENEAERGLIELCCTPLGASTVRSTRDKGDQAADDPIKYRPLSTWQARDKLHIVKNNKSACNNKKTNVHCPNKEITATQVPWTKCTEMPAVVPNGVSSRLISNCG